MVPQRVKMTHIGESNLGCGFLEFTMRSIYLRLISQAERQLNQEKAYR